jgi:hypothetical protein
MMVSMDTASSRARGTQPDSEDSNRGDRTWRQARAEEETVALPTGDMVDMARVGVKGSHLTQKRGEGKCRKKTKEQQKLLKL